MRIPFSLISPLSNFIKPVIKLNNVVLLAPFPPTNEISYQVLKEVFSNPDIRNNFISPQFIAQQRR